MILHSTNELIGGEAYSSIDVTHGQRLGHRFFLAVFPQLHCAQQDYVCKGTFGASYRVTCSNNFAQFPPLSDDQEAY
jgi:hypothetical protein